MKIVLYTRRNVGLITLSYLKATGHTVKVITDDAHVAWLANSLECEMVDLYTMREFDLFLCVHGNKIVPMDLLNGKLAINIHPCLFKYKGHNPIKRYIEFRDIEGSVAAHHMTEKVDEGEVICELKFHTGVVDTYEMFYNIASPYYYKILNAVLKEISN